MLPLLLALVVALTMQGAAAGAASFEERALEQARARVDRVAGALQQAAGAREAATRSLAEADAMLADVEAAVNEAAAALERQQTAVETARADVARLQAAHRHLLEAFAARAASVYKNGSGMPFEILLASGNVDDALERTAFLRIITESDRATLEDVRNSEIALHAQRLRLDAETERLERIRGEREALLADVQALRRDRALVLAETRRREAGLREQMDDVAADAKRVEELIAQRQAAPSSASAPSTAGYIWPVCGAVTSGFGRRWGRMHQGVDIDGDTGDVIAAAKDGVVIFVGWQNGYGNLTIVDHGDGVATAYAHQSAFFVHEGETVLRGQRLGAVGNTGRSTGPHLHFETRVRGSAVDPRRFLPRSC